MIRASRLFYAAAGLALVGASAVALLRSQWLSGGGAVEPLTATGGEPVTVLDFGKSFALEPVPRGWRHRKFWFVPPMQLSLQVHRGVAALRCETRAGGSIYGRHTDLDVAARPVLDWRWFVEVPIAGEVDERTREGDDHPVRLFLEFRDTENAPHRAEIIWANRQFKPGDYKYIGGFPHLVADGGDANIGRWRDETADLLAMYRKITGRADNPRLTFLAVFCDSDNTKTRSIAYTSDVRLRSR